MANLFSGLEEFGFKDISNIEIFEKKEAEKKTKVNKKVEIQEEDLIFDKTFTCPACDSEVKSKAIRAGKVKLLSLDSDLRPRYQFVDTLKYDVIVCQKCGFAALERYFKGLTSIQIKLIKENITSSFKGVDNSAPTISYDEAISRHKLALVNAVVKKAKNSERAYLCLKTAWVIRGKKENLKEDAPDYKEIVAQLDKEELAFLKNAFEGFKVAYSSEGFPICGMDEPTLTLLIAELARKSGDKEQASRWISQVLTSKQASDRIKERAREIKEML